MRAAGRSRREIMAELCVGDDLLGRLLAGTEVPDSLTRPQAKDDLRARATELRLGGATYDEIAKSLGVSKSSCSLWLRDLPRPEDDPRRRAEAEARRTQALRQRLRRDRDTRDDQGRQVSAAVAESLGAITSRDLVLAMAVSYWCEGGKAKPWNRQKQIHWMNSDPVLVRLFLEGLSLLDVDPVRLSLRLHIHETADEPAARSWWSEQTQVPLGQFAPSTIKRHNPRTNRQNRLEGYRGCLCVTVRQGRALYEVIDGLLQGVAGAPRDVRS